MFIIAEGNPRLPAVNDGPDLKDCLSSARTLFLRDFINLDSGRNSWK